MNKCIEKYHMLKHPFYQKWNNGELSLSDLKNYCLQYNSHVESFPCFVSSVHSLCVNSNARKILLENLLDEEGYINNRPHPRLWKNFGKGLGLKEFDFNNIKYGYYSNKLVDDFFVLTRKSYASGLGALYAYEAQIPEVAKVKIIGLRKYFGIHDKETLSFFSTHEKADIYHSKACQKLIAELSENEIMQASESAELACKSVWNFLSEVENYDSRN